MEDLDFGVSVFVLFSFCKIALYFKNVDMVFFCLVLGFLRFCSFVCLFCYHTLFSLSKEPWHVASCFLHFLFFLQIN